MERSGWKLARATLTLMVLSLSGCGGSYEPGPAPGTIPEGRPHLMPTRFTPRTQATAGSHLNYYGGHVMSQVKVVNVYWGQSINPQVTAWAGPYFSAITNSPYFDFLQEYDTRVNTANGGPGTNQVIYRGSWLKDVTITPSVTGTTIDDTQIVTELDKQISSGVLPPPDLNTMYMTFFPAGVSITAGGSASCQAFCAYHNSFLHNGVDAIYGVMPDLTGACASGCGPGDIIGNNEDCSSHELIESVTDAQVGEVTGTALAAPLAWISNDANQDEIGDLCVGQDGTAAGYLVQLEWSNALNACVDHNPAVGPAPSPTATPVSSPTPGGTPTPEPTATPGTDNGAVTVGKGCGCDLTASGGLSTAPLLALAGLAFGLSHRRRV